MGAISINGSLASGRSSNRSCPGASARRCPTGTAARTARRRTRARFSADEVDAIICNEDPLTGRGRDHGAGPELGRLDHAAAGLFRADWGDLRRARRPARGRRGHLRVRSGRRLVRFDPVRIEPDMMTMAGVAYERLRAARRARRQPEGDRAVLRRAHDDVPPRHHVRRTPSSVRSLSRISPRCSSGRIWSATCSDTRTSSAGAFEELAADHPMVGDVRGDGFFYFQARAHVATRETAHVHARTSVTT